MDRQNNVEYNSSIRDASLEYFISKVQCENTKNYIADRILSQMKWYSSKSYENKRKYHFWMTVSILLGAMIPVVSVFADGAMWVKVLIATLGAAVTACNSYISLHHFKDLWFTYRNTREALLRILYSYFNSAGIFSQSGTQEEKDILLVKLCEEELSHKTDEWFSLIKK